MRTRVPFGVLFLLLLFGAASSLLGQEVFAPFVSRLKVVAENDTVVITWKDSPDVTDARYIILRSTAEITDKNFSLAALAGDVAGGVESFIDRPDPGVPWYYAVLIKDKSGKIYELFIPFRNKTIAPVSVAKREEESPAIISGIRTTLSSDSSVTIEFASSSPSRTFNLYASTKPIVSIDSLLAATRISSFSSSQTRYVDYPLPGIPYYYAVIDAAELKTGDITFSPGANTTREPIEVPLSPGVAGRGSSFTGRSQPLPFYNISQSIMEGSSLTASPFLTVRPVSLREATVAAVENLVSLYVPPKRQAAEPAMLPEERGDSISGERQYLREIVSRSILQKNWKEGELALKRFLSVRRSAEIESSARFYLGQVLYFQGKKNEACLEFLLVKGHDAERMAWLDRILSEQAWARSMGS
jgi:hypothetical protein